jgi:hypothetical protein
MTSNDAGDFSRDNKPLSHDPINTVDGSTPGVQSHVPGEDDSASSVGGTAPGGSALDHAGDAEAPGEQGLSNAGDSVDDAGFGADQGVGDGTGLGEGNGNTGQSPDEEPGVAAPPHPFRTQSTGAPDGCVRNG